MNKVKLAVILAAGGGTRIRDKIGEVPKGFIELDSKPIIERSIENLINVGINRIIIVTGYLSEYYDALRKKYSALETIRNEKYADSGSMYSLYVARDLIKENFLLLESDLIYERRALTELLENQKENAVLISGKTNSGDEVYIDSKKGKISNITKTLSKVESLAGELVGISKISLPLFDVMKDLSEDLFKDSLHQEYETDAIAMSAKRYPVNYHLVEDLAWAEIDDEIHLVRAKEIIFPKIIQNDKNF